MAETVLPPFEVTPAAIDKITNLDGQLRLDVQQGGCCGWTYVFEQSPPHGDDAVFGCPGAELSVSSDALDVMAAARLDYNDKIKPPRFRVLRNPNTPDRCPCNRSFGREWAGRGQVGCRAKCVMPWDES
jgi:iron-sulfur cluster assembly accessory protein